LKIIARDQPDPPVPAVDLGLPPTVILVSEDGEDVALCEAELFRNRCLVQVERSSYMSHLLVSRLFHSREV
jgi:hypothetical protein